VAGEENQGAFFNNWKNSALPASGSTISNVQGGYAGYKGGQSSVSGDPFAIDLLNSSPAQIKAIADLLVAAGYLKKTTNKYNKALADAYSNANSEAAFEASRSGRPTLSTREFLIENAAPSDAGGTPRGPSTQRTARIDDDSTADARVAKVLEGLGLEATPERLKEWRKKLQAEQKKNPITTKYSVKDGVNVASTTGGLDDDFWLEQNIAKAFKSEIDANALKDPEIEKRTKLKSVYNQVTKGLTGDALASAGAKTEYGRGLTETINKVKDYITESGATLTDDEVRSFAEQIYDSGQKTDSDTIRSLLRGKIVVGKDGALGGRAGENLADLVKTAKANGLDLNKAFGGQVQNWLQSIEQGESVDTYKQIIRSVAKLGLPDKVGGLLDQGVDLDTIYSPYRRQMASLLEVDEDAIDLDDPLLRSAIGPDKEQTLYDYKKMIRKDPRWQYTDNAREEVSDIALGVLRDFGFQG
jgi:hypothetical protein